MEHVHHLFNVLTGKNITLVHLYLEKQFCQETGAHKFMAMPCHPAGPGYHPIPKGKLI